MNETHKNKKVYYTDTAYQKLCVNLFFCNSSEPYFSQVFTTTVNNLSIKIFVVT